ncbi:hypothetical protein QOT17_018506 [Balamuthia mandrillaris]
MFLSAFLKSKLLFCLLCMLMLLFYAVEAQNERAKYNEDDSTYWDDENFDPDLNYFSGDQSYGDYPPSYSSSASGSFGDVNTGDANSNNKDNEEDPEDKPPTIPISSPSGRVLIQLDNEAPHHTLRVKDRCSGELLPAKDFSLRVVFDRIQELGSNKEVLRDLRFPKGTYQAKGSSSYSKKEWRAAEDEDSGVEEMRFDAQKNVMGSTKMGVRFQLFKKELEETFSDVTFSVHPDTFKWSLEMQDYPFLLPSSSKSTSSAAAEGEEEQEERLRVTLALSTPMPLVPTVAVLRLPHMRQTIYRLFVENGFVDEVIGEKRRREDASQPVLSVDIRLFDVVELIDAETGQVTVKNISHHFDIERRQLTLGFPAFASILNYDPDISLLLDSSSDYEEGEGEGRCKEEVGSDPFDSSSAFLSSVEGRALAFGLSLGIAVLVVGLAILLGTIYLRKRRVKRMQALNQRLNRLHEISSFCSA